MAKSKREEASDKPGPGEEGYEFELPQFDEAAFMRREVEGSRVTFVALGLAIVAGLLARVAELGGDWRFGFLPILAALVGLKPLLDRMHYSADVTSVKASFGNWFLMFFTALSVWILLHNIPGL